MTASVARTQRMQGRRRQATVRVGRAALAIVAAGASFLGATSFVTSVMQQRLATSHIRGLREVSLVLRAASPALALRGFADMSVADLKAACKGKGLPISGKKADLVARLEGAGSAAPAEAAQAESPTADSKGSKKAGKAVAKSETTTSISGFLVGDKVDALYEEENKNYEAIVQRVNDDGTYLITWTEDGYEYTCKAENMKLKTRQSLKLNFQAGDAVEGLYHEEEKWYTGRVKYVDDAGMYTVVWDCDGEDYQLEQKDMKVPTPKIPLSDLQLGQLYKGRVGRTFHFGVFIDIGAERDGLMTPFYMYEGTEPAFKEGDMVEALYEDEADPYEALVKKDNGDGTYDLVWIEDDDEYTAKKSVMTLRRVKELEENEEVNVYVEQVRTQNDGTQRLSLALFESKVGVRPPPRPQNFAAFENLSSEEWLKGTVQKIMSFGAIVRVTPPGGGAAVSGLVHITEVRDGFVENLQDELQLNQEVDVCIKSVDKTQQRMSLSMKGC